MFKLVQKIGFYKRISNLPCHFYDINYVSEKGDIILVLKADNSTTTFLNRNGIICTSSILENFWGYIKS